MTTRPYTAAYFHKDTTKFRGDPQVKQQVQVRLSQLWEEIQTGRRVLLDRGKPRPKQKAAPLACGGNPNLAQVVKK